MRPTRQLRGGIASLNDIVNSGYVDGGKVVFYGDFNDETLGLVQKSDGDFTYVRSTGTSMYGNYSTKTGLFLQNRNEDGFAKWVKDGDNTVLSLSQSKISSGALFAVFAHSWGKNDLPTADFVYQMDVKVGGEGAIPDGAFIQILNQTGGDKTIVNLNANGILTSAVNGEYLCTLGKDAYTTVAVYVKQGTDGTDGKYWVYIDGVNVNTDGYAYTGTSGSFMAKGVRCYHGANINNTAVYADMLFDNIQFYYVKTNYTSNTYFGKTASKADVKYVPEFNDVLASGYVKRSDMLFYADFNKKSGNVTRLDKNASTLNTSMYSSSKNNPWLFTMTGGGDGMVVDYASWYTEADGNTALSISAIPEGSSNTEFHLNICPWGWGKDTTNLDTDFVYQMSIKRTADQIWEGGLMYARVKTASDAVTDYHFAYVDTNGNIYAGNSKSGAPVGKLELNEYTTVAVYLDAKESDTTARYYLYINGVNVNPDGYALARRTEGVGLSFMRCYQANNTINADITFLDNAMLFDDIQFYYVNNGAKNEFTSSSYIGAQASLLGSSLSMEGMIGVNYYVKANTNYITDLSELSAKFTVNGVEQKSKITKVDVPVEGYKITAYVPAPEMAKKITGYIADKDGNAIYNFKAVTARELAVTYINGEYAEEAKAAAKAMLNYAAAAQTNFGVDVDKLVNAGYESNVDNTAAINTAASSLTVSGSIEGVTYSSFALGLESETAMYHFFNVTDTDASKYTVSCNGTDLKFEMIGNRLRVKLEGIKAKDLATVYEIKVTYNETDSVTVSCNAMAYAKAAVNSTASAITSEVKATMNALYAYYFAASAYANK